jgi:hypothetical protein
MVRKKIALELNRGKFEFSDKEARESKRPA